MADKEKSHEMTRAEIQRNLSKKDQDELL